MSIENLRFLNTIRSVKETFSPISKQMDLVFERTSLEYLKKKTIKGIEMRQKNRTIQVESRDVLFEVNIPKREPEKPKTRTKFNNYKSQIVEL